MNASDFYTALRTDPCTVVGLGVSNLPLIDFLLANGARVCARDRKTAEELGSVAEDLQAKGVTLMLGDSYLDNIEKGLLFRSPGLRPDLPAFVDAVSRGATLTSEMELFLALTPARVIAVTGSDGKTTTTTLTGKMLARACALRGYGRVFVGGNIGTPLLPLVKEMTADDFAVLELSSFQLQTMQHSPHVSAITNVSPNHLDWHTDMAEYVKAKENVFAHAPNEHLVLNLENEITAAIGSRYGGRKTYFSSLRQDPSQFPLQDGDCAVFARDGFVRLWDGNAEHPLLCISDILLPGTHNLENYMTAIALTYGMADASIYTEIATTFEGVEHRLERIRVHNGVTYYNSSIDSSPSRTAAALSALNTSPIVICGGYDKQIPFAPLAEALCRHAKAVVLTGATAQKIRAALDACDAVQNGALPIYEEPDFTRAVYRAHDLAQAGDTVLLSPACASFDAFANFAERGNAFRKIVESFSNTPQTQTERTPS